MDPESGSPKNLTPVFPFWAILLQFSNEIWTLGFLGDAKYHVAHILWHGFVSKHVPEF